MFNHVNKLLEMAEYFKRIGERDLEKSCRDTATKICDHILYVKQQERAMSVTIERMGEHRQEDWAIQMFAVAMRDEIAPHIAKKELPYFHALMSAVQRHPDLFRRKGYTFNGMRFSQHERDRRGKLVRCVADFGSEPPTDEMIEKACKVGV